MQARIEVGPVIEAVLRSRHAAVLAITLASYFMIVLDISIVITALPKIRDSLGFSATELSWVQNAYTLTFGGLLLLGARAGDIVGRRRMFVVGLAFFTATSLAIGLAQSTRWLTGARALQGVGAAILAPSTLALLTTSFWEGPERTRALAYYAAVAGIGASVGLVLGGVLADWISWRAGFFINVPVGIALMLAAQRYLGETPRRRGELDVAGAMSSTLGMTLLVYGIVRSASEGWTDRLTIMAVVAGVSLLLLFVLNEGRARQPIMPLRLFARRERSAAYVARVLYLGAMVGFWFFTTQFLQAIIDYSPFEAGLAFLPTTLPNFAAAMAVPKLTVAGVAGVAAEDAGSASGLVNVAHQLGGSLGLGMLVTVSAAAGSATLPARELFARQISAAFVGGTVMLAFALAVVYALIVRSTRHGQTEGFPSNVSSESKARK